MSLLAYITWDVSPIIAQLGPLTLRWYGVLFALGFVLGSFILTHIYRTERVSAQWVDIITLYMIIGTVVGARLGHVFFYDWAAYKQHPWEILKIWHGGLASHGATIGILLALWLFSRRHKFDYLWVLDRIVIVVAVGGACIRLGNLMNSEIVGRATNVPWAFIFPRDAEHTTVPRHPTQIYESLFCVFLLVLLYWLWNKYKERTPRGLLFGLFVVLLFTFRFLVEFLKENQVDFENNLQFNMGQLLSIPLILLGVYVLLRAGKWPNNPYGYAVRDLSEEEANKAAVKKV
jgi:prolipoprotein diacylglyceryl transferase